MITLKNVVLRRSAKVLLDSASVTINPGEKVGLVGRNGAGKSTLFALLTARYTKTVATFMCRRSGAWPKWPRTCPKPNKARPSS